MKEPPNEPYTDQIKTKACDILGRTVNLLNPPNPFDTRSLDRNSGNLCEEYLKPINPSSVTWDQSQESRATQEAFNPDVELSEMDQSTSNLLPFWNFYGLPDILTRKRFKERSARCVVYDTYTLGLGAYMPKLVPFEDGFVRVEVNALPIWNENDEGVKARYLSFFQKYGTHTITSAYFGWRYYGQIWSTANQSQSFDTFVYNAKPHLGLHNCKIVDPDEYQNFLTASSTSIQVRGGRVRTTSEVCRSVSIWSGAFRDWLDDIENGITPELINVSTEFVGKILDRNGLDHATDLASAYRFFLNKANTEHCLSSSITGPIPSERDVSGLAKGLAYGIYKINSRDIPRYLDILRKNLDHYKNLRPFQTGLTTQIGYKLVHDPLHTISIYGGPPIPGDWIVINHRGFFVPPESGNYEFSTNGSVDDVVCVWLGDSAFEHSTANAVLEVGFSHSGSHKAELLKGVFYPIRVVLVNGQEDAILRLRITDPAGEAIVDWQGQRVKECRCLVPRHPGGRNFPEFGRET